MSCKTAYEKGGERFRGKESIWKGDLELKHVVVEGQALEAKGFKCKDCEGGWEYTY